MWPQYLCLSIAFEIVSGKEGWRQRWNYYLRYISTLEPFLESTAQLVIKLCIWTFFNQAHLEREREENPLIDETGELFFYFSTCVSALASVLGIIRFFKDGPVRFLPQTGPVGGIITLKFLFTFLAVLLSSASKILLLVLMLFYSLGVLPVLLQPPSIGIDLVGTTSEPKCSDLSLVQACGDASFQVKLHSPDPETVIPSDPGWRVFLREEDQGVRMWWNATDSQWWEGSKVCVNAPTLRGGSCDRGLPNNCGGSSTLYCTDPVTIGSLQFNVSIVTVSRIISASLWLSLNLFPPYLVAVLAILVTDVKGTFKSVLHSPQLMLSPLLTNITFGPKDLFWQCKSEKSNKIGVSQGLYWINCLASFLGQIISLHLLYVHYRQADPSRREERIPHFGQYLTQGYDTDSRRNFNLDFVPPGLVLLFHMLSVAFFAIVIHIQTWKSPTCSFLAPLDCQNIPITSFIPQIVGEVSEVKNENTVSDGVELVTVGMISTGIVLAIPTE